MPVCSRVVMYTVPLDGSITGVEVEPMYGFRSEQPIVAALKGMPNDRVHSIAPVLALIPYA